MGTPRSSPQPNRQSSSKRKVSGPTSEPKRQRNNGSSKSPAEHSAPKDATWTHSILPQFFTNGLRRISSAWRGVKPPPPKDASPQGDSEPEAILPVEDAEMTSLVDSASDVGASGPPQSYDGRPPGDEGKYLFTPREAEVTSFVDIVPETAASNPPQSSHGQSLGDEDNHLLAAGEAEAASFVDTPLDVDASNPLQSSQPLVEEDKRSLSPVDSVSPERLTISPANELQGHIRCRLYLESIDRSELHSHSVLDSSDFNDMYRAYCMARNLVVDPRDSVPYRLFCSVVSKYGEKLEHVRHYNPHAAVLALTLA